MVKRKEGMSIIKDREYLKAENNAYDKLVEHGYTPQGITNDFKKVVVFRIENKHRENEKRGIFYFNNWQEAMEILCG
ncbi:hypothetical protein [Alkaliphilus sp. B6464]|uniref:hypothetical protein n=1 Tax=Alkaliphilus sp. B6464 TaxID=2731219 RepID=UPI001BA9A843|nr:hypothetical protein [Alkaliphilus sp. B6464]QUH21792.1 hypothetical protein HYG84_17810 [Alkaliphilus sp. B6464]